MDPQSEDSQLRVAVKLVENVNALNNLADVSHVEDVMRLGWSGQEIINNGVVNVYCCCCEGFRYLLDVVVEVLSEEFVRQDIMINSTHLALRGEGKVEH
jgi:hypothetical protein